MLPGWFRRLPAQPPRSANPPRVELLPIAPVVAALPDEVDAAATADVSSDDQPYEIASPDVMRLDDPHLRRQFAQFTTWYNWFITPEGEKRLNEAYPDLMPNGNDPLEWYFGRATELERSPWRHAWWGFLGMCGPLLVVGIEWYLLSRRAPSGIGGISLAIGTVVVYWVLSFGAFMERMTQLRQAGLFQSLLLAGQRPERAALLLFRRATTEYQPLVAWMIGQGVLMASLLNVLDRIDMIVLLAFTIFYLRNAWDIAPERFDERSYGSLILLIGVYMSGRTSAIPGRLLGAVAWLMPTIGFVSVVAMFGLLFQGAMLSGAWLGFSYSARLAVFIFASVALMVAVLEYASALTRPLWELSNLRESFGDKP